MIGGQLAGEPDPSACDGNGERLYYRDRDRDGYGDPSTVMAACAAPSDKWVEQAGDCADREPAAHPGQNAYFEAGYPLPDGERVSYDYDCDGQESGAPDQSLALDCGDDQLLDLDCQAPPGYLPNDVRSDALPPGGSKYCGSDTSAWCVGLGLVGCETEQETVDVRFRCR